MANRHLETSSDSLMRKSNADCLFSLPSVGDARSDCCVHFRANPYGSPPSRHRSWSGGPRFLFIPFGLGAALTFVSLVERGTPFVVALAATLAVMIALGIIVERAVLEPLINQPPITLFIATLGLSDIIEGVAQLLWGTQVHGLDIGISKIPFDVDGCVFISWFDLFAAAVAGSLVALFTLFLRAPSPRGASRPCKSVCNVIDAR